MNDEELIERVQKLEWERCGCTRASEISELFANFLLDRERTPSELLCTLVEGQGPALIEVALELNHGRRAAALEMLGGRSRE